jgi:FKBP-type peptidyl-prolyl cis-trans isomerase
MNFKNLFFSLLVIAAFVSCNSGDNKTPSGYDYRIETKGDGAEAKPNTYVYFTLQIKDENGKVLQSLEEGPNMPIMFLDSIKPENAEPNPILDVLGMSRVGDVIVLVMPVDSIPNPPAEIKDMKHIEYYMTIKNVTDKAGYDQYMLNLEQEMKQKRMASLEKLPAIEELVKNTVKDYGSGALTLTKTASGLQYLIVEEGQGDKVKNGQTVSVNYYGVLKDGKQFDNSFTRGQSFDFTVGNGMVIKGWDEGLTLLNKGAKAFLFVPAELGYGAEDSPQIPANSELIFYVEVLDVK